MLGKEEVIDKKPNELSDAKNKSLGKKEAFFNLFMYENFKSIWTKSRRKQAMDCKQENVKIIQRNFKFQNFWRFG